ncbi:MAG: glycosyltransferase, partial [Candidatus Altarchaeaceae archaeon]
MKILFFTDTYFPQINGVSFVVRNHAKKLIEKGHDVEIFAPKSNEKKNEDIKVNYLDAVNFFFYPGYYVIIPSLRNLKILKEISKKNFDVIHCHTPFSAGIFGIIIARILRKKRKKLLLVGTYHTILSEFVYVLPFPKRMRGIIGKIADYYSVIFYNLMDFVITPSEYTKNLLKSYGVKKPIFAISNGIDLNLFNNENKNKNSEKIKEKFNADHLILHVGRISKERNID